MDVSGLGLCLGPKPLGAENKSGSRGHGDETTAGVLEVRHQEMLFRELKNAKSCVDYLSRSGEKKSKVMTSSFCFYFTESQRVPSPPPVALLISAMIVSPRSVHRAPEARWIESN